MTTTFTARWQQGVVRPQRIHIQETQDGVPRVANAPYGHTGNIAICRAWTAGDLVNPAKHATFERCGFCVQTLNDLHLAERAGP